MRPPVAPLGLALAGSETNGRLTSPLPPLLRSPSASLRPPPANSANDYFGSGNTECLCATCERTQRGFFARALAPPPPPPPPPLSPPAPAPAAVDRRGERSGTRSSTPEAVRSEEGDGDEEVSLLLGEDGKNRDSGGLPDGASSSTLGGKQHQHQQHEAGRAVAPLPRRSTTAAAAAAAAAGKMPSPPLALSTSASPGPLPRPLPASHAARPPTPLGRCPRCSGTLALTARVNGLVVPACPRCWRHRKLHGLLWTSKAQTGRAAERLGPGSLTDTENGVFYGPEWENGDGDSTEDDDDDADGGGGGGGVGGAGARIDSADELELAIRRKQKGREWDGDAFELCEKADYKVRPLPPLPLLPPRSARGRATTGLTRDPRNLPHPRSPASSA